MNRVRHTNGLFAFPSLPVESVSDSKYEGRIIVSSSGFDAALRLRRDVFRNELANAPETDLYADRDEYDSKCVHLLITEIESGAPVGTYRLNAFEGSVEGFYASGEFDLGQIPKAVLEQSVELGRACIAKEHRNSRVLFLLWRLLANYMTAVNCRYLFGCCSVFTQDPKAAADILARLDSEGHVDNVLPVTPRPEASIMPAGYIPIPSKAEIPPLVSIYMRIGAVVCGEPAIDRKMKTVDYFVVFDLEEINRKYRKMFFRD